MTILVMARGYRTSHHKGDLQGIIDSLDYIKSLEVNAVWLTPIFDSVAIEGQNHWADRLDSTGYYASNYFTIDPRFGSMEKSERIC
jgi:glycosidase